MKPSLRTVLADSHVAFVAIAMLVFGSLAWLCQLVWFPFSGVPSFLNDVFVFFPDVQYADVQYAYSRDLRPIFSLQFSLQLFFSMLGGAIVYFTAAWALSLWVYGTGPFEALVACHSRLRRKHG